jgi:hypothetical protein
MESVDNVNECFTNDLDVSFQVIVMKSCIKDRVLLISMTCLLIFSSNSDCRDTFLSEDLMLILDELSVISDWMRRIFGFNFNVLMWSCFIQLINEFVSKWVAIIDQTHHDAELVRLNMVCQLIKAYCELDSFSDIGWNMLQELCCAFMVKWSSRC